MYFLFNSSEVLKFNPKLYFPFYFSFMNGDAIRFKSVFTALAVIYAADKYMVKKIDILALKFIRKNLTVNDSLMILQHLYFLHGDENGRDDHVVQDMEPSAPTLGICGIGHTCSCITNLCY